MKYTANKVLHRDRTITSHCVKSDRKPIGVKGRREMNERRKNSQPWSSCYQPEHSQSSNGDGGTGTL